MFMFMLDIVSQNSKLKNRVYRHPKTCFSVLKNSGLPGFSVSVKTGLETLMSNFMEKHDIFSNSQQWEILPHHDLLESLECWTQALDDGYGLVFISITGRHLIVYHIKN